MTESLRLPEKRYEGLMDTVICVGDDDNREVIFKETIPQLLDAQIADLLSKVPPEKLKEEIAKILCDFGKSCDYDPQKYSCPHPSCAIAPYIDLVMEKVQPFALSLQEQAKREERKRVIKYLVNNAKCPSNMSIKECKRNTFCNICWEQVLQKEG